MQISVKTWKGTLITLDVEASDTINEVKAKIKRKEKNIKADQHHLILEGKRLEDDQTLSFYNIGEDMELRLALTWLHFLERAVKFLVLAAMVASVDVLFDVFTTYIYFDDGLIYFGIVCVVLLCASPTCAWVFLYVSDADPGPFWKFATTYKIWEEAWDSMKTNRPSFGLAFVALGETCVEAFPTSMIQQFSVMSRIVRDDGITYYVLRWSMVSSLVLMSKTLTAFDFYGRRKHRWTEYVIRGLFRLGEVGSRSLSLSHFWLLLRPMDAASHGLSSVHMPILLLISLLANFVMLKRYATNLPTGQHIVWACVFMLASPPSFLTVFKDFRSRFWLYRALEAAVMVLLVAKLGESPMYRIWDNLGFANTLIGCVVILGISSALETFSVAAKPESSYEELPATEDAHLAKMESGEEGVDPDESPLITAIEENDVLMARLLGKLTDLNKPIAKNRIPMYFATTVRMVEVLYEAGTDPTSSYAPHVLTENLKKSGGENGVTSKLLELGVRIDAEGKLAVLDKFRDAVKTDDFEAVRWYVGKGAAQLIPDLDSTEDVLFHQFLWMLAKVLADGKKPTALDFLTACLERDGFEDLAAELVNLGVKEVKYAEGKLLGMIPFESLKLIAGDLYDITEEDLPCDDGDKLKESTLRNFIQTREDGSAERDLIVKRLIGFAQESLIKAESDDKGIRPIAAHFLAKLPRKDEMSKEALLKVVSDVDKDVRLAAVKFFAGVAEDDPCKEALIKASSDDDKDIRKIAVRRLVRFAKNDEHCKVTLIKAISDVDKDVRRLVVKFLARVAEDDACKEALIKALYDKDKVVRFNAVNALVRCYANNEHVKLELVRTSSDSDRESSSIVLKEVVIKDFLGKDEDKQLAYSKHLETLGVSFDYRDFLTLGDGPLVLLQGSCAWLSFGSGSLERLREVVGGNIEAMEELGLKVADLKNCPRVLLKMYGVDLASELLKKELEKDPGLPEYLRKLEQAKSEAYGLVDVFFDTVLPTVDFFTDSCSMVIYIIQRQFQFLGIVLIGIAFNVASSTAYLIDSVRNDNESLYTMRSIWLNICSFGLYAFVFESLYCWKTGQKTELLLAFKAAEAMESVISFVVGCYSLLIAGFLEGYPALDVASIRAEHCNSNEAWWFGVLPSQLPREDGQWKCWRNLFFMWIRWLSVGSSLLTLPLGVWRSHSLKLAKARVTRRNEMSYFDSNCRGCNGITACLIVMHVSEFAWLVSLPVFQIFYRPFGILFFFTYSCVSSWVITCQIRSNTVSDEEGARLRRSQRVNNRAYSFFIGTPKNMLLGSVGDRSSDKLVCLWRCLSIILLWILIAIGARHTPNELRIHLEQPGSIFLLGIAMCGSVMFMIVFAAQWAQGRFIYTILQTQTQYNAPPESDAESEE